MGNGASEPVELTEEQKDIQRLGKRFPYGDAELQRLYAAYKGILMQETHQSFLIDWTLAAVSSDQGYDEDRDEPKLLMQIKCNQFYQICIKL